MEPERSVDMANIEYTVQVEWDDEAQVWVASSENIPGLATGADTIDLLMEKLRIVVPELLEENGMLPATQEAVDVPFTVMARWTERVRSHA